MFGQNNNPFFVKRSPENSSRKGISTMIQILVVLVVIIVLSLIFVITPNQINGFSMYPTFDDDEIVLTNRFIQWGGAIGLSDTINYDYQRGDVVVFHSNSEEGAIVKRVIALPGETIVISQSRVFVDGKILTESYLTNGTITYNGDFLLEDMPYTLQEEEYFVMGDNRTKSVDSRYSELGPVKRNQITGKVIARVYPLDKFDLVQRGEYNEPTY